MELSGPLGSAEHFCLGPRPATLPHALGTSLPPASQILKAAAQAWLHTAFIHTSQTGTDQRLGDL